MLRYREGEHKPYPYRSGRIFNVNGEWYFATRENAAHGPYTERECAEEACRRFLASVQAAQHTTAG